MNKYYDIVDEVVLQLLPVNFGSTEAQRNVSIHDITRSVVRGYFDGPCCGLPDTFEDVVRLIVGVKMLSPNMWILINGSNMAVRDVLDVYQYASWDTVVGYHNYMRSELFDMPDMTNPTVYLRTCLYNLIIDGNGIWIDYKIKKEH